MGRSRWNPHTGSRRDVAPDRSPRRAEDTPNTWDCASLASGSVVEAKQTNFSTGDGIPDDSVSRAYVTLTLPAGAYMVIGKAVIDENEDDRGFVLTNGVGCDLVDDTVIKDTTAYELKDSNDGQGINTNPLTVVGISDGGTVTLQCYASSDVDLVSVKFGKLVAMRVA